MIVDSFVELVSDSPWTYVVIVVVAALDAVLPLVPSEATVISAGVLAGAGDLHLALVIAAGAAGAYGGDASAYWIGGAQTSASRGRSSAAPQVGGDANGPAGRSVVTAGRSFSERASFPAAGQRRL